MKNRKGLGWGGNRVGGTQDHRVVTTQMTMKLERNKE